MSIDYVKHKKILIIDDDEGVLEALQAAFESTDYAIEFRRDGEGVEGLVEGMQPDLILLDYLLSGKNGGDLCVILKANPRTERIPVVVFSAHPSAEAAIRACGADGFLAKPFAMADLLLQIKQLT
jgi:DNA-binding response OmpR family regulator